MASVREMIVGNGNKPNGCKQQVASTVADERDDRPDGYRTQTAAQIHAHEERGVCLPLFARGGVTRYDSLHDRLRRANTDAEQGGGKKQDDAV